jgi:hypothetical protein
MERMNGCALHPHGKTPIGRMLLAKRAYDSAVRSTRLPWYGFTIQNCRTLSGLKVKAY